ncbi:hypothetical protein [Streptomyces seoulensis]|uniref:hypothetical protein n=1 Tax=Streptomyces seoulensis TaxID=73044 RepID=UPI00131E71BC|nr:hypothetical protein [Streptomyces seoulensis]
MNLPAASPAFDATRGRRQRDRGDLAADIGDGCYLPLPELIALTVVYGPLFR